VGFTKIIRSGNFLEIYEYSKELNVNRAIARPKRRRKVDCVFRTFRVDNVRRKIKAFRRLVQANLTGAQNPSFFTFTMFESVGIKLSYVAFTVFAKRLRADTGLDFRYIVVPEFQKDTDFYGRRKTRGGAVHFHALIWGLNDLQLEETTSRYIQNTWARGTVDCISTDGNIKLAGYFAKYMRKAMYDSRLLGRKAYSSSSNVLRPLSLAYGSSLDYAQEIWGVDLSTGENCLQDRTFETQWLGKGRYRLIELK